MAIVTKGRIHSRYQAAPLNEYVVLIVNENIRDRRIPEQRLKRSKTKDFSQKISLNLLLLLIGQRHLLIDHNFVDHAGNRATSLTGVDPRQLLQIQLRDQNPMHFRFELL